MLFRLYSLFSSLALLLAFASLDGSDGMKESYQDAKSFIQGGGFGFNENVNNLEGFDLAQGDSFDAGDAANRVTSNEYPKNEILEYVSGNDYQDNVDSALIDPDEGYFDAGEAVVQDPLSTTSQIVVDEGVSYSIEKCRRSGSAYPVEAILTLVVEVNHTPEIKKEKKLCKIHHVTQNFSKKKDAKRAKDVWIAKLKEKLERGVLYGYGVGKIRSKGVWPFNEYLLEVEWHHKPNVDECDLFDIDATILQKESWLIKENWVWSGVSEKQAQDVSLSLVSQEILEGASERLINGKLVYRDCWKKRFIFLVNPEDINECLSLKGRGCTLIEKRCLKKNPEGKCLLWENSYRCSRNGCQNVISTDGSSIFGLDGRVDVPDEVPNTSFANAATTLSIFSGIEKELEEQQSDASKAILFKATMNKCDKSFFENVLYDCCSKMGGFANDIHLAKCNTVEEALSKRRKKGLCHHIGSRKNKTGGMAFSTTHGFACFPTKLGRILQEQARKQLGRGWGSVDSPDLSGLTPEMIAKLDFSEMDFSELFEGQLDSLNPDITDRLINYKPKLSDIKEKMEKII